MNKRKITNQDIDFLKKLQNEMLTQDNFRQANPRFWVIAQTEKEWGVEDGYETGSAYIDSEGLELYTLKQLLEYLIECDYIKQNKANDFLNNVDEFDNDSLTEWLEENKIDINNDFQVLNYRDRQHSVIKDTFFLTLEEARKHLKQNHYNYNSTAHVFAMTAWRSPEVEKLYDILLNVDFDMF